jgi:hypothetical protein
MKTLNQNELAIVSGGDNPGMGPYNPPQTLNQLIKKIDNPIATLIAYVLK